MEIAALSIGISQTKVQQDASIQVMKMALGNIKDQGNMVSELLSPSTKGMEHAVLPHLGGNLDIRL